VDSKRLKGNEEKDQLNRKNRGRNVRWTKQDSRKPDRKPLYVEKSI